MFVTFDGGDGGGKTGVIEEVVRLLMEADYDVISLREPGGVKISEMIRAILIDPNNSEMSHECEALLYAAARAQLYDQVVKQKLESPDRIVILDRYFDASIVYQGITRGLGMERVMQINNFPNPDVTFILDVDPKVGIERTRKAAALDRFELEGIEFHEKIRAGYLALPELFKDSKRIFEIIDTTEMSQVQVLETVIEKLMGFIAAKEEYGIR